MFLWWSADPVLRLWRRGSPRPQPARRTPQGIMRFRARFGAAGRRFGIICLKRLSRDERPVGIRTKKNPGTRDVGTSRSPDSYFVK